MASPVGHAPKPDIVYPVIVDIEGVLVAANSARPLYERLSQLDIVEAKSETLPSHPHDRLRKAFLESHPVL